MGSTLSFLGTSERRGKHDGKNVSRAKVAQATACFEGWCKWLVPLDTMVDTGRTARRPHDPTPNPRQLSISCSHALVSSFFFFVFLMRAISRMPKKLPRRTWHSSVRASNALYVRTYLPTLVVQRPNTVHYGLLDSRTRKKRRLSGCYSSIKCCNWNFLFWAFRFSGMFLFFCCFRGRATHLFVYYTGMLPSFFFFFFSNRLCLGSLVWARVTTYISHLVLSLETKNLDGHWVYMLVCPFPMPSDRNNSFAQLRP